MQGIGNEECSGSGHCPPPSFSLSISFYTFDANPGEATTPIQSWSSPQLICLERPSQKFLEMCHPRNSNPDKLTNEDQPFHSFTSDPPNL